MAWFRNYYKCDECGVSWMDEWSCACDDDCPECGSRHYSPYDSDDLSVLVEEESPNKFTVYYSPETAEDEPSYVRLACIEKGLANLVTQIASGLIGTGQEMAIETHDADSWLEEIANCVLRLEKVEFTLLEVYNFENGIAKKYPQNKNIRAKIRQQLQRLRDQGKLEFLGRGNYRLR